MQENLVQPESGLKMMRSLLCAITGILLAANGAFAQSCGGGLPHAFSSGNVASAAEVNANFNYIVNCFATLGANTFTGAQTLPADPTANLQAATKQYVDNSSAGAVLRSYLAGLGMSTAGGSASLAVAAGQAADSTNTAMMSLSSSLTKTTSAWAVGNNQGGLDTGTVATNTWYHVYLIKRTDTGVVDALFSTSATTPTLPTSYTLSRRIGSARTNGSSQWTAFIQDGDEFLWSSPVQDVSGNALTTTSTLFTLSVPPGVSVNALFSAFATNGGNASVLIQPPASSTQSVSTQGANSSLVVVAGSSGNATAAHFNIRTNTSGQIRAVSSIGGGVSGFSVSTLGWTDRRGRDN
jgi:hypothetical protein